tara:strand:- start:3121 stop:4038 length:918 start_codon:yes stop_codon:yes gene_type:complete
MFFLKTLIIVSIAMLYQNALALRFELKPDQNVYGAIKATTYDNHDGLFEFSRKYDVAHDVLLAANPELREEKIPKNTVVMLPLKFILPAAPRKGIVINLAERRLYIFSKDGKYVDTFPVSIGKEEWDTPLGRHKIVEKRENPVWYVPKSLYDAQVAKGVDMPKYVLPGEDNPLGKFAMRLSITSYLIHGTNTPERVGRRQTAGCISLYPEDIKRLFAMSSIGTSVLIVNQPVKMAMQDGQLIVESHEPLEESWQLPSFKEPKSKDEKLLKVVYDRWKRSKNSSDQLLMKVIQQQAGIPRVVKTRV